MALSAQDNSTAQSDADSNNQPHKTFFLYDPNYIFGRILHVQIEGLKELLYKLLCTEDMG